MQYEELIDILRVARNKPCLGQYLTEKQLKSLQMHNFDLEQRKNLSEQLMSIIRFSNIPLIKSFFDEEIGNERIQIEKKLWNDLNRKEIYDLSSIIWSISAGRLTPMILIKLDESKSSSVKRFSFLLAIIAQMNDGSAYNIYKSVIDNKNLLYDFYKDEQNLLYSFLSEYSKFFIEQCFFLVGTLWFGGDSFEYSFNEYAKNFAFSDELYKQVVKKLQDNQNITLNQQSIIKLNKKGLNNVRMSLVLLLSYWTLLYGTKLEKNHVLPHSIYSNYMIFGRNYNMKLVEKEVNKEKKKRRISYKIVSKIYDYTYVFWSNIFDSIYKNPLLQLKKKYEDVRLFVFRYSLSPILNDIVSNEDSEGYLELIKLFEELNIVKIVQIDDRELVLLSKEILGWLFEDSEISK